MCHPKNTSKLKTPSLLADPVIKPAPTVWKNSGVSRLNWLPLHEMLQSLLGFTQRCWGLLKGVHRSQMSGHTERFGDVWRPSFLWFLAPPATDSKALGIHGACSRFVFTNKRHSKTIIFPIFHQTFSWTDFALISTNSQYFPAKLRTKSLLFHLQLLQLQVHVVVPLCLTKKKKNMELDSEGRQCWLELLSGPKSLLGRTRTNILKWHHFPFQYLKILNIMFQRDACLLKVPESPKTISLTLKLLASWGPWQHSFEISASRPSISWWRRLEKEQLVKRHGAGMPWIRNYSNFMVNPKPLNIQQTKK